MHRYIIKLLQHICDLRLMLFSMADCDSIKDFGVASRKPWTKVNDKYENDFKHDNDDY